MTYIFDTHTLARSVIATTTLVHSLALHSSVVVVVVVVLYFRQ